MMNAKNLKNRMKKLLRMMSWEAYLEDQDGASNEDRALEYRIKLAPIYSALSASAFFPM